MGNIFETLLEAFRELLYSIPAILLSISLHEASHGFMSYRLGDPTPKNMGRITLNPFKHLDPLGTLCLLITRRFGWAKPVQVNPMYYKNRKWGMALVALAGPLSNFILAFASLIAYILIGRFAPVNAVTNYIHSFFFTMVFMNIGLGVFNLFPIPPLDGSKILSVVLPEHTYFKIMRYEQYIQVVLLICLFMGWLSKPINVVVNWVFNFFVFLVTPLLQVLS